MRIYIVIPAHNEADFIGLTLQSLVKQTFLPSKIVVVNDQSTDETPKIVQEFIENHPFIQLKNTTSSEAHQPGSKVINAFNAGLAELDEDYDLICKFDADLIFPENYLETIVDIFKKDPKTGLPRKSEFGPWMRHVFKVLSRLKGLRGTRFDCFGWTQERRTERELREQYFADIKRMCGSLSKDNYELAVELAEVPEQIRGFGHVKLDALCDATLGREGILGRLAKSKKQERAA